MPWWLRPTKPGRFYARHKKCRIREKQGSNSLGYYTLWECDEPRGTYSWKHHQHRYGEASSHPFVPSRYWQ